MEVFSIISLALLAAYLLLLAYYGRGWRLLRSFNPATQHFHIKVTIIIPARNEAATIPNCLAAIAAQTYPRHLLEVIVVDDFSTDATAAIVQGFTQLPVKLLRLADFVDEQATNSFKKKGIELAVQQATGQLVVTTDADCVAGPGWIAAIAGLYQKTGAVFIAAPVRLLPGKAITAPGNEQRARWRFVEIFQALDFFSLQVITAGSVQLNFHTMCNGANLAYTREAFLAVNGFAGIDAIASGDDMLLMYKMHCRFPGQVKYLKSRAAIVSTAAMPGWRSFLNQRIRWASKAGHYQDKRVFRALLLVYLLNVVALAIMVIPFFLPQYGRWALMFISVKCIAELAFLWQAAKFYNMQRLLLWFPFCQPLHIVYTVVAGWLGKFGRYRWKGRVVN